MATGDHAGEEQDARVEPASRDEGHAIHHRDGEQRADGCKRGHAPSGGQPDHDGDHCAERSATGKAKQPGFGERIANHRLQRGPGHGQRTTDGERQQHARHTELANDVGMWTITGEQRAQHIAGCDANCSKQQGTDAHHHAAHDKQG